jgi:hypothetical protein
VSRQHLGVIPVPPRLMTVSLGPITRYTFESFLGGTDVLLSVRREPHTGDTHFTISVTI